MKSLLVAALLGCLSKNMTFFYRFCNVSSSVLYSLSEVCGYNILYVFVPVCLYIVAVLVDGERVKWCVTSPAELAKCRSLEGSTKLTCVDRASIIDCLTAIKVRKFTNIIQSHFQGT